ncbi:unnamed protein product [Diamesa serratosioi]
MFARQIVKAIVPAVQNAQKRGVSVIAGPPMNRVSMGEKLVTGLVMTSAMLFVPAWVLLHIKEYKGQE